MMKTTSLSHRVAASSRRRAFTLVEILVAVSIMAVLLTVIMVPLRMGFESFTAGKSRSDVQLHAQLTLDQIANDLKKAQFVFPNAYLPGISNNSRPASRCSSAPYKTGSAGTEEFRWNSRPYVITDTDDATTKSTPTGTYGVCTAQSNGTVGVRAWDNVSRIDMLQKRRKGTGEVLNSDVGQDFIVTYYPRRLDITKPFDVVDNPIVLFRAQIPFRGANGENPALPFKPNGSNYSNGPDFNANIDWTQYPSDIGNCSGPQTNRAFLWITHNFFGEADLQPLTADVPSTPIVPGAHTEATPRDMSLVAPAAGSGKKESMVPELSFREESSDGRRIDRVTITMTLAQYDSTGTATTNGQAAAQRVRVSRTVELPNVACGP